MWAEVNQKREGHMESKGLTALFIYLVSYYYFFLYEHIDYALAKQWARRRRAICVWVISHRSGRFPSTHDLQISNWPPGNGLNIPQRCRTLADLTSRRAPCAPIVHAATFAALEESPCPAYSERSRVMLNHFCSSLSSQRYVRNVHKPNFSTFPVFVFPLEPHTVLAVLVLWCHKGHW